jgi:hypothetical protein
MQIIHLLIYPINVAIVNDSCWNQPDQTNVDIALRKDVIISEDAIKKPLKQNFKRTKHTIELEIKVATRKENDENKKAKINFTIIYWRNYIMSLQMKLKRK